MAIFGACPAQIDEVYSHFSRTSAPLKYFSILTPTIFVSTLHRARCEDRRPAERPLFTSYTANEGNKSAPTKGDCLWPLGLHDFTFSMVFLRRASGIMNSTDCR